MSESTLIASGSKLTREELALVPTPAGTATHKPIPHAEVITALTETLGFRHIAIHRGEYAVSSLLVPQRGLPATLAQARPPPSRRPSAP